MILDLKDIFRGISGGASFAYSLDFSDIEYLGEKPYKKPVLARGEVKNIAGAVLLNAEAEVFISLNCARCNRPAELTKTIGIECTVAGSETDAGENDDIIIAGDSKLDLDELILSSVILETDTVILCKPDCKGLCPKCGADLNEGDCNCPQKDIDPRLEKLKKLL